MTIYGIFAIHGVTDLMAWLKAPLFPMFNYVTALLSFLWYGIAFYYHANMHGKEPVEVIVHVLPIFIMFLVSIAIVLEMKWQDGVWTMVTRAYGVLTLGTWFSHVAFMLFVHNKFPGGERSNLDRSDLNNVIFVKAMFGMHLFVNLLITITVYVMVYLVFKLRLGITLKTGLEKTLHEYQHLSLCDSKFDHEGKQFKRMDGHENGPETSPMLLEPEI
ncbi:transmembrane protein 45B [Elysia marginata]|uniref:Transmembrane protein 45B n=1 Tax=Elysia marginata TaxID=1093978 RepID=A0AAV4EIX5_9GAST|nr:transmembrane protein 45B [Elysia marginata]